MPLKPRDLKTAFEDAFNAKMERLMKSQNFDEYKAANAELADTLVEAIEKYIKGADVDHEVPVDVETTVTGPTNTYGAMVPGAMGTGKTIPKKKVGKIT
tara:strand:- start:56 stop:352 length:297 start_codon:yes stop_codon:yes gene_type:complete